MTSTMYDALVLGAGPAGLSTALCLARVHRRVALYSKETFRNDGIHAMHGVAGLDGVSPAQFRATARAQILKYGTVDFIDTQIVNVRRAKDQGGHDAFEVRDDSNRKWVGRKLMLAMGCKDVFPPIDGYAENWPNNIYQCLVCDRIERGHLPKGILTFPSPQWLHFALTAKSVSLENSSVTVFTHGPLVKGDEMDKAVETAKAAGCEIDERRITRLTPNEDGEVGVTISFAEDSDPVKVGFLTHEPPTELVGKDLIDSLGVETMHTPYGVVIKKSEPFQETNIKGIFTAGDAGSPLTQVTIAMSSGACAAAGILNQLLHEDADTELEKSKTSQMEMVDR